MVTKIRKRIIALIVILCLVFIIFLVEGLNPLII